MSTITVPEGLVARSMTRDDVPGIFIVVSECERAADGAAELALSDVEADWRRPDFDPARMSMGVLDGDELIATGEVFKGRAEVDVLPTYRGRGIGTALLHWTWDVARADGRDRVGQTISDAKTDAADLFRANGYEAGHCSWILRIDVEEEPPPPPLPAGLTFRDYRPGLDDREVFDVIDTAFDEWPDRESHGFDNWVETALRREEVRPELVPLVTDGERVVGVALNLDYGPANEGWVEQLAVERSYRGLGVGRALLVETFRRFHRIGRRMCGVSTDSRTGALGLYEHVGMSVSRSYTRWSKALG
jgi:GNAT superfamily N-acetyltransferase